MSKRYIIAAVIVAIAAVAGVARADTSNVLGPGGNPPKLDARCHRAVMHLHPGHTFLKLKAFVLASNENNQAQIHCLIRRADRQQQSKYVRVTKIGSQLATLVTVQCPPGTKVFGGGWQPTDLDNNEVEGSWPSSDTTWTIRRAHDNNHNRLIAWATCA